MSLSHKNKWYDEEKEVYVSENDVGIIFGVYPLVGNSESMQKELSNIFTINTVENVNIEWIPTSGDGKQYYILFVTNISNQIKSETQQNQADATTNN